jgi:hypothetical protein
MSKLHCLVSATATTFAVLANAQPFSSVVGSWGYGGYGAFHAQVVAGVICSTDQALWPCDAHPHELPKVGPLG